MSAEIAALKEQIINSAEIDATVIDALNRLTQLQLEKAMPEAHETALKALGHARTNSYKKAEVQALIHLGTIATNQRKYTQAEAFYKEALSATEQLNDDAGTALVFVKLGGVKLFEGKYNEALQYYEQALDYRTRLNDEFGIANIQSNMGLIYGLQGIYISALNAHMQALTTYERLNEEARIASACSNIGLIYTERHNFDEALHMFERALTIRQKQEDTKGVGDLLSNIGNVYYAKGEHEKALEFYDKARVLREELGDKAKAVNLYINLGSVYKALKQNQKALEYNTKALELSRFLNEKRSLLQSYINLGELSFELEELQKSADYYAQAIELAKETGIKTSLSVAIHGLAEVQARTGRFEQAYNLHREYMEVEKEISNTETSKVIAQMTMRYEIEQKEKANELERIKNAELKEAYSSLEEEKKRSDDLLNNILPEEVSQELKQYGKTRASSFEQVTVMFADIQNFTKISEQLSAEELVSSIAEYFEAFDKIVGLHELEKIKTIGDAYLCAGGIPVPTTNHAEKIILAARDFVSAIERLNAQRGTSGKTTFNFRIGAHTGPIVAGVVGFKKFAYDIWGDTVNTAARMQQHSLPGKINISQTTYNLVKNQFDCHYRGEIEAKNKGKMQMYFVV